MCTTPTQRQHSSKGLKTRTGQQPDAPRRAGHRHRRRRQGLVGHPGHGEAAPRRDGPAPRRGDDPGDRQRDGLPARPRAEAARHQREHQHPRQVVRHRHHHPAHRAMGMADHVPTGLLPIEAPDLNEEHHHPILLDLWKATNRARHRHPQPDLSGLTLGAIREGYVLGECYTIC